MYLAAAIRQFWDLWDRLFQKEWAEIVVPTVAPAGKQFIGFLIPADKMTLKDVDRFANLYGDVQSEVAVVNKPFGEKNRACLSVLFRFDEHLSQYDLDRAAESLRNQIRMMFKIPSFPVRMINCMDAERRLT